MTQTTFIVRFGQKLVVALLIGCSLPAAAEDSSDTFIGYRYGTRFREPHIPSEITKNIVEFAHASTYRYGSNYLNIDYFKSRQRRRLGRGSGVIPHVSQSVAVWQGQR